MSHNYSKDQMKTNNQIAQQQLAAQQQQLQQYQAYVKQLMSGGGYLPGVKSALTSNAINTLGQGYQGVGQQLNTIAAQRGLAGGGNLPGGGGYLRDYGSMLSAEENQRSQLLNNITAGGQQNIAQAQQGVLQGAGINAGVGSSALGAATNSANSATANSSGILGSILGGAAGVGGALISENPKGIFS